MSYILIAEDDPDLMMLVQRKLELSGYENTWATPSGKIALEQALNDPPLLAIFDIMLPDMDGLTVCREIKSQLGDQAPPIILMSARGQKSHEEGKEAGGDAYIAKPFSPNDLMVIVDSLLDA